MIWRFENVLRILEVFFFTFVKVLINISSQTDTVVLLHHCDFHFGRCV
ncbi:unnamed protein product [Acanthoscelides obtectus]|uniref:Uncharacterized protein n=1 Tax=Acanthoscelides obtectus TaxID=200917 RepID=A0A9P0PT93_ACAOB|nr:unnamed protein product [Acanthoscelides obtectus]CAK1627157.1 hypothetical protein AOBTE_LOCUS4347 [Acanthoscelides obtectus]